MNRRDFIKFLGASGITITNAHFLLNLSGCTTTTKKTELPFTPHPPSFEDKLKLVDGLRFEYLIGWKDQLNPKDYFGYNNDFTSFIPIENKSDEGLLWVNHESVTSLFVSGAPKGSRKTKEQIEKERYAVGGSIVHIKKDSSGKWTYIKNSKWNHRINAFTEIPFSNNYEIQGKKSAMGTLANCSGGKTPWGNILTCEENFQYFVGPSAKYNWGIHFPYPEEHYGWVVEVEPFSGISKKLIPLGRFSHEAAHVVIAADGRPVVYMGDDKSNECLYKFISDKKDSLEQGTLYVANLESGQWIPLTIENPKLSPHFKTQLDLLIQTRKAAKMVGGTELDRPEDLEQDPFTKSIYIACTHNEQAERYHGYVLSIDEADQNPLSLSFRSSKFLEGGEKAGFTSPDNFALDKKGNLWMTIDISEDKIGNETYKYFGNNALFYIPLHGPHRGIAFQVASAPVDSELTGPSFSPDGRTLFLSVQHPGSRTVDKRNPTSRWPDYGDTEPRPAVVAISGPLLDQLISENNTF